MKKPNRLIIVDIDGLRRDVFRAALADGQLPNVERIVGGREGATRLEMELQPTLLDELVETVLTTGQVLAESKGLTLECNLARPGPLALADPERIKQVLSNLLGNAIRYTPAGGQVTLSTRARKVRGRTWATVMVSDTGIGIPKDELPHIFERFFRGESPRLMQIPGTGLGLAIVKEIVELHGGWVTVESTVNVGATFTVWLPIADAQA